MPISLISIEIDNEMNGSTGSLSLKGNLYNKMTATIRFNVYKLAQATLSTQIECAPSGYGSLDYIKAIGGAPLFADFDIGDNIIINSGANAGNYVIIEKLSNSLMRLDSAMTNEVLNSGEQVIGNDDFDAIEFQYGLIENSEAINFLSKVDGSAMRYKHDAVTTSHTPMTATGLYSSWKINGSYPTIKHVFPAVSSQGKDFEVVHVFYILPPLTYDLDLSTPPAWFDGTDALKYVFSVKAKYYPASTEGILYREFNIGGGGNTGWLDENYNTGITNYSVANLTYTKVSDSSSVDGVMLVSGDKTRVNFTINSSDTPFSNSNTKVKIIVHNVPFDTDEYVEVSTPIDVNFTYDEKLTTLGAAAAVGSFGSGIEAFTATYVSTSQITVQFDINLDPADVTRINAYDEKYFFIGVSVCDHTLDINSSDNVTLGVDFAEYAINLGTDGVVTTVEWNNYYHPDFVAETEDTHEEVFSEDEIRSVLHLKIDTNSSVYTPSLRSIEAGVRLINTITGDIVELDRVYLDVSGNPIVAGLQYVNTTIPRAHKAMSSEDFKRVKIERDLTLDATNEWHYIVDFPFLVGWEDFTANTDIPTDFFDTALENNGQNNEWAHLKDDADYEVQVFCNVVIRFNGVDYEYNLNKLIIPYTYESNPTVWTNPDIKVYDEDGNLLPDLILGYAPTKVVCEFEYIGSGSPTVTDVSRDVEIVIRIEPKDAGGRNVSTRFSSVFDLTSETQWTGLYAAIPKVIVTKVGSVFYGTAMLDHTLLQTYSQFDITARIYDKTIGTLDGAKLLESGDFKLMESGDFKLLE